MGVPSELGVKGELKGKWRGRIDLSFTTPPSDPKPVSKIGRAHV